MTAETVVPLIRTRKRRLVAPDKRKKAVFSCDRCKLRKIACHRNSPTSPCDGCVKAKQECETTIKRKKRIKGPIENIGLHYKCLLVLVKNMYPDIDVNNIDALIDLGERQGFQMPSRYGGSNDDDNKELRELSVVITSGRPLLAPSSAHSESGSDSYFVKKEELEGVESQKSQDVVKGDFNFGGASQYKSDDRIDFGSGFKAVEHKAGGLRTDSSGSVPLFGPFEKAFVLNQKLDIPHKDYIIIDLGGNSHCIGPLGAPGFLDLYMKIIGLKADVDLLKWLTFQKIAKGEMIILSNHEPMQQRNLKFLYLEKFPYFGAIDRKAANYYVDVFFQNVHSRCLCFTEKSFRLLHEKFWESLDAKDKSRSLANHSVCSLYMVWILGRLYDPTDNTVAVEEGIMQQYLHIVKLCLSDILLTATLDGIRTLLLLSIYMDNSKRRETGYILIELAARQAVTLGLSRRSLTLCTESEDRREEMKRTWWTVFIMEVGFLGQMGRSSCIQMEDVNADLPECLDVPDYPDYAQVFVGTVGLTKYLYEVLQYRKSLLNASNILADDNVCKALEIQRDLTHLFESFPVELHNLQDFKLSKLVLHYRYHYYCLLLTLPFFLHVANTPLIVMTESIMSLINQCARLSIAVADLAELSALHRVLNGTLFPDIFYAYHAVMGLVVSFLMIKDNNYTDCFEFSLADLEKAVRKIKNLHLSQLKSVGGTLQKISKYIDAFVAGLEYFKCRPTKLLHYPTVDTRDDPIVVRSENPVLSSSRNQEEIAAPILDAELEELFPFPSRLGLGLGEFSIGSLDFGDMLQDYSVPSFGMSEALFKIDGF